MIRPGRASIAACALALAACGEGPPKALGTLEYDRVTVPAPVAEKIVSIDVREGEQVAEGAVLLTLDRTRVEAETRAAQEEAQGRRDALAELEAGARSEQVRQARANLAAAQADADDASAYYERVKGLADRKLVAVSDVDRARAAASSTNARVGAAQAQLDELLHGTRRSRSRRARRRSAPPRPPRPRNGRSSTSCGSSRRATAGSTACRTGSATRHRSGRRSWCSSSAKRRTRASTSPSRSARA
jgi:hypothetical protein